MFFPSTYYLTFADYFLFYRYDLDKVYQKALKDSGLWLIVIFQYSYLVDPSST